MNGNHHIDVDNLIVRTQKEDNRNKRLMNAIFILYLVCSILYAALFLLNPDPELTLMDRMAGMCYVLAFVTGSFFFRREYLIYKKMDYSIPLLQLLEKTEKRYRFFTRKFLPVLVIVTLIDMGISITFMNGRHLQSFSITEKFFMIQAVYWGLMFTSGFIGYLIWRKRSYPIWKDSKTLLSELKD